MENDFTNFEGVVEVDEKVKVLTPEVKAIQKTENQTSIEKKPALTTNESGVLFGKTLDEQYRLATAYSRSGIMPAALNTPEKILVALQICYELKLNPMSSIGKIAVINGSPSLFGDLPLALVMRSGEMEYIKENFLSEEVAECKIKRKNSDEITRTFSIAEAKQAGLIDKNGRVWKAYPKRMLQMRARSWALKDAFPDVLLGNHIAEYDFNVIPGEGEAPINPAEKLKLALSEEVKNG